MSQHVEEGVDITQLHRHILCLYGEDEKLIRLAAMELGLTMTAFVRLALELYLSTLAMEKQSQRLVTDKELTWEGIRLIEAIQIFAVNAGNRPFSRNLTCLRFEIDSYW